MIAKNASLLFTSMFYFEFVLSVKFICEPSNCLFIFLHIKAIKKMVPQTHSECSWLQDAFHDLAKDLPTEKSSTESQNITRTLRNHKGAVAKLQNFEADVEMKQRLFDYERAAKESRQWLADKQTTIAEPPVWESLETLNKQIEEHEVSQMDLDCIHERLI